MKTASRVCRRSGPFPCVFTSTGPAPTTTARSLGSTTPCRRRFLFRKDTIPATSGLTFRWHGEPTIQATYVTGYKYKLAESHFVEVPPDSSSHTYRLGTVTPGTKLFTLKVLDQAGGAAKTTRNFQMNYAPDTWLAGPDLNLLPLVNGERSLTL